MSVAPDDAAWLVVVKPAGEPWQVRWFAHDEQVSEFEESLLEAGCEGFSVLFLPDALVENGDEDEYGYAMLAGMLRAVARPIEDHHLPQGGGDMAAGQVVAGGDPPVAP